MKDFAVFLLFVCFFLLLFIDTMEIHLPKSYWTCTRVIEAKEYNQTATCDQWTRKETK